MMFNRKNTKTLNSSLLPLGRRWHGVPDEGCSILRNELTPHPTLSPRGEGYDETHYEGTGTNSCNEVYPEKWTRKK